MTQGPANGPTHAGQRAAVPWHAVRRSAAAMALLVLTLTLVWGCAVRATTEDRWVAVRGDTAGVRDVAGIVDVATVVDTAAVPDTAAGGVDTVRVLAWNIAHGRGDLMQGNLQNFRGGGTVARNARLARIAEVILAVDADVVVLNEVDFDAAWSGGVNQAKVLAWATGYPTWIEQRNFEYSVLFADFAFGNAVLTRLPVRATRPVQLPPHSDLEAALIGAKTAAAVDLMTAAGALTVVPIHLEFRSEATRRAAVPPLLALRDHAPPLLLAGDFNTGPPHWPRTADTTAVGALLGAGFTSPRAAAGPGAGFTFPAPDPRRGIDWILAEPPLRVLESRVVVSVPGIPDVAALSDHLPVLSVIEVR